MGREECFSGASEKPIRRKDIQSVLVIGRMEVPLNSWIQNYADNEICASEHLPEMIGRHFWLQGLRTSKI